MTTLQIDHSQHFQYQPGMTRTTEEILAWAPGTTGYISSVTIDQFHGYSASTLLRYVQIHHGLNFPIQAGEVPLISIPVPAGMPFSWQAPPQGYTSPLLGMRFVWAISTTGPVFTVGPTGDSQFWFLMQGRVTVGFTS